MVDEYGEEDELRGEAGTQGPMIGEETPLDEELGAVEVQEVIIPIAIEEGAAEAAPVRRGRRLVKRLLLIAGAAGAMLCASIVVRALLRR
jgi:hypothetical protein